MRLVKYNTNPILALHENMALFNTSGLHQGSHMKIFLSNLWLPIFMVLAHVLPATPLHGVSPVQKAAGVPQIPFGFTFGKTTLEDAGAAWNDNSSKILAKGYASFGAGSGVDYLGHARNDKLYMVDIASVDFEGTYNIRFSFFENKLYSISIKFTSLLQNKLPQDRIYKAEDVKNIEAALRSKYGPPARSGKDLLAGPQPNILAWEFSDNRLLLYYGIDSQLSYYNIKISKAAEDYRKLLIKTQIRENQNKQ